MMYRDLVIRLLFEAVVVLGQFCFTTALDGFNGPIDSCGLTPATEYASVIGNSKIYRSGIAEAFNSDDNNVAKICGGALDNPSLEPGCGKNAWSDVATAEDCAKFCVWMNDEHLFRKLPAKPNYVNHTYGCGAFTYTNEVCAPRIIDLQGLSYAELETGDDIAGPYVETCTVKNVDFLYVLALPDPSAAPTKTPTSAPVTVAPSRGPTTSKPTPLPSTTPSLSPTTSAPTLLPTTPPTLLPSTSQPTFLPSVSPTKPPATSVPSTSPSTQPPTGSTASPLTPSPTTSPTYQPTGSPTSLPSRLPSTTPTHYPTLPPSTSPTQSPTSSAPSSAPSTSPTSTPTVSPTTNPTVSPSISPSTSPTVSPSISPTSSPSQSPSRLPTSTPSSSTPTSSPTTSPSLSPTVAVSAGASSGAVAVGAGVGASVVMIIIVVVVLVVILRGKNQKKKQPPTTTFIIPNQYNNNTTVATDNANFKVTRTEPDVGPFQTVLTVRRASMDRDMDSPQPIASDLDSETTTTTTTTTAVPELRSRQPSAKLNVSHGITPLDIDAFDEMDTNAAGPEDLPPGVTVGTMNRYKNILPNAHSRVILPQIGDDVTSSYINANYITSIDGVRNEYIAAQGPKPDCVIPFWRMIWQDNIKVIIMVTGLVERKKIKCARYWPDAVFTGSPNSGIVKYGDITVVVTSAKQRKGFKVATLEARQNGEARTIMHFWFDSWPDFGVPENADSVIGMLQMAHNANPDREAAPWLVHCSAGIGRTGTFIGIDAGMQYIDKLNAVDTLMLIKKMRESRGGMIQTSEQYEFLHTVLSAYFDKVQKDKVQPVKAEESLYGNIEHNAEGNVVYVNLPDQQENLYSNTDSLSLHSVEPFYRVTSEQTATQLSNGNLTGRRKQPSVKQDKYGVSSVEA